MQKMATSYEETLKNAPSPDLVAKVVLDVVRNENSNLRHLAGKDVAMLLETRKNMSDVEFQNLIKKFNLQNIQAQQLLR
jgi:hypothetical protein